jgi:hypothetical protein
MVFNTLIRETTKSDKRYHAGGMLRAFVWTLSMLVSVPLPALAETSLTPVALKSKPVAVTNSLWRVSVKVINENNGTPPETSGWGQADRAEMLDKFVDAVDGGNDVLTFTERKIRLDLVEIIELEGLSSWNSGEVECAIILGELDQAAKLDPLTYAWRDDAINVYYVRCAGSHNGVGQLPKDGRTVVVRPTFGRLTLILELGHHFGLEHTHKGIGAAVAKNCDEHYPETFPRIYLEPGDDGIVDTVPDHPCWSADDMANNTAGVDYEDLLPGEERVLNTYANLMSYHVPVAEIPETQKRRLTNEQWELILHKATTSRAREVAQGLQRVIDVSPFLTDLERNAERDQLIDEFLGSWVAVDGDDHWVSSLDFREDPNSEGQLIGALDSSMTSGSTGQVWFQPSLYTDALTGVPDPGWVESAVNGA